jgi:hypothetical protein
MRRLVHFIVLLFALVPLLTFAQTGTAWVEADRLFHSDPLWLGGDAAFSIDLGQGRVLWLFQDSFIANKPGEQLRSVSGMIRNSIAIESGYDPSRASIHFCWRYDNGAARSFFPEENGNWLWPLHGINADHKLLLFLSVMGSDPSPRSLGFRSVGTTALLIDNPEQQPLQWKIHKVLLPDNPWKITLGISVVHRGRYLYLFGYDEPAHNVYLARTLISSAMAGDLSKIEWWSATGRVWRSEGQGQSGPSPIFSNGSTELSIQWDASIKSYVEVQSVGFGASEIGIRRSKHLYGPWSEVQSVYRPPESDGPAPFVYAGKGHPELLGAELIVTYATNGPDDRLMKDMHLYFPRFVRIDLSVGKDLKNLSRCCGATEAHPAQNEHLR